MSVQPMLFTAIRTENVRGTIQSITDNSVSSGTTAIVDLAWEADYALTNNQNRPHDVNQDGANDFERFDKIGNTGYNLRLDLDDNTQRTYAVVPYTGTVDLDQSTLMTTVHMKYPIHSATNWCMFHMDR